MPIQRSERSVVTDHHHRFLFPGLLGAVALALSGCLSGSSDPDPAPDNGDDPESVETFTVGGEAQGIEGETVELLLNGDESLSVDADGSFRFDIELDDGAEYVVAIAEQPAYRDCGIENAEGSIEGANVDDVLVSCAGAIELTGISGIMQFHLHWDGPDLVDLKYSSDPDCDWENYSTCSNAGMIADVSDGEKRLESLTDGFDPDTPWYFVVESKGLRSNQVSVQGGPPNFLGGWSLVQDLLVHEETLYVAGDFAQVSMATGGGTILGLEEGAYRAAMPMIDGTIHAVEADGAGGWFIGGEIARIGETSVDNLARIRADGSLHPEWSGGTDGAVHALARHEGTLFVGGAFTQAGKMGDMESRDHLAAFAGNTGELDEVWNPGANNQVLALVAEDDLVHAGGAFSEVGQDNIGVHYAAAFDRDSGAPEDGWTPAFDDEVRALLRIGDDLYVGGAFEAVDSVDHAGALARLGATDGVVDESWEASTWDPFGRAGTVFDLSLHDGALYVGGSFAEAGPGEESRENLAAFDIDNGELKGWDPGADNSVHAIQRHDGVLYVAGQFSNIGNGSNVDGSERFALAAIDAGPDAQALDWAPHAGGIVHSLAIQDSRVFAGGEFELAGGTQTRGLAALDTESGVLDPERTPNVLGSPRSLAQLGQRIYLGGSFEEVNGEGRSNAAAFNAETGELSSWDPGFDNTVQSLAIDSDGTLYAGGLFAQAGGGSGNGNFEHDRDSLAAIDADNGEVLAWDPGASSSVYSMYLDAGEEALFVGGNFREIGGGSGNVNYDHQRNRLAKLDGNDGSVRDWDPNADNRIRAMAFGPDNMLIVGGWFTEIGGDSASGEHEVARQRVAAVDRSDGSIGDWDPGTDSLVKAVAVDGDTVWIGGRFHEVGGGSAEDNFGYDRKHVAVVSAAPSAEVEDPDPGLNERVRAIKMVPGLGVVIGGQFTRAGGGSGDEPDHRARTGLIVVDPDTGELMW